MCFRENYARLPSRRGRSTAGLILLLLAISWTGADGQNTVRKLPTAAATQTKTSIGHPADTRTGTPVAAASGKPSQTTNGRQGQVNSGATNTRSSGTSSGSNGNGAEDAAIIAGSALVIAGTIWAIHHHEHSLPSPESLLQNGPQVPQNVAMSHLVVDGLIGPGWPVGVDFALEGPGSLMLDITTSDKVIYHQILTNDLNGRGITITWPDGLPDKVQAATFDLEAVAPAGSNLPPPSARIYGIAAGRQAVGSIAIDEVTFGPSTVQKNQQAQYSFHSHSDFSSVRADFMYTGLKDNQIVMRQDTDTKLPPVARDGRPQGSLQGKGTAGQHLLQIRAWRGDSGDWVVAWSPDIVNLTP